MKMKKILFLITCVLLFVCISSSTLADEPILEVDFSHNGADTLKKGDVVTCTLTCENIKSPGLSSFDLVFNYSDGLQYNYDCATSPLPDGWVLWDPAVKENEIRVGVIDESVVSAGFDNIELTLSFTVVSDSFTEENITLEKRDFYDFDLLLREDYTYTETAESFVVNLPKVSVENIGASLRLNSTPALRFGARIENFGTKGSVFGMLVCPSDKLSGELTHTTPDAKVYTFTSALFDKTFSTPAVEVSSIDEEYTFRPFVKFTTENTNKAYHILFDSVERSAKDVATLALEGETDEERISLLNGILSGT